MKPRVASHPTEAMTLMEVVVVIAVLTVLVVLVLPMENSHRAARKVDCAHNLKIMGLSMRIWAGDNGDKYPFELSVTNGGTMELNFGNNAWINFQVMSNELSVPKILVCPRDYDHWPPATSFSAQLAHHLSYFVGLDAKALRPQTILSGDANFAINGVAVKSGRLEFAKDAPIGWTAGRHGLTGHILLVDGSVHSLKNSELTDRLSQTGVATNHFAIP